MSKMVCAYIRVSTDSQDEYSPDAQIRLLKEYASSNDMILADIYQDIGISGRKAEKRPEFQKMIALAKSKEHPYDSILVWKFSRFARNQEESIVYKSLLKKNNVEVISVSEPLPDGFIGDLVERIFEWMDEYYSIRLSGEVIRGMTQKAMQGGYNSKPPIGYNKEKGADTVPIVDDYYAGMVKRCFHMYGIEHLPLAKIAATINDMGYRTRRGNKWESRNIVDMIQNPFYLGKVRWNNANSRSKHHEGEEIVVEGRHEPIISEELWQKANDYYKQMSACQNHSKRADIYKHWLSGLIKCPECGGTLAYQRGFDKRRNKSYPYFICYKAVKGMCHNNSHIPAIKLENHIMNGLLDVIENGEIKPLKPIPTFNEDLANLDKAVASIKNKLVRVRDAYLNGIDTLEEYTNTKRTLEAELEKIQTQYSSAPSPTPVTREQVKYVYDYIKQNDAAEDKSAAIHTIVDYIVYYKDNNVMEFFFNQR